MMTEQRVVTLANSREANLLVKGTGAPLVFLHPAQGRIWSPFLDRLAETHTVYVPQTPGSDEPEDLLAFNSFADLAIWYDDLFRALGLDSAVVIGHAFGGMAAAEFAAHYPDRVSQLVLIGAKGLWSDDNPVADVHTTHPSELAALLFNDPAGEAALSVLQKPTPQDRLDYQLALAAALHFYWPIPDRDLKQRLYRITAPTLLVWGDGDRVVPPLYADTFAAGIKSASKVLIPDAGHFPHLENLEDTLKAVAGFIGAKVPATA